MEDVKHFIDEKASEEELYDLKFSERLDSFYIERFTNNFKYFFLNIKGGFFFYKLIKEKNLKKKIKKISFLNEFIKKTGFDEFDFTRLIQLEKIIKKNKPKIIFEFGSGVSTVWISYIINKFNLDSKIFSFDNNKFYQDKLKKNIDKNILKNITFRLEELKLFKYKNRRFVRYNNTPLLESVDLLYIDAPVLYDYKENKNTKFIKSGDIIYSLANNLHLPKMILTDGKYDLYPMINHFKKYKKRLDRVYRSLVYEKVND